MGLIIIKKADPPASDSGDRIWILTSVVLISPCQSVLMAAIYLEMYQKNKKPGLIETEARKQAK